MVLEEADSIANVRQMSDVCSEMHTLRMSVMYEQLNALQVFYLLQYIDNSFKCVCIIHPCL